MASRHQRARRRVTLLVVLVAAVAIGSLLAGVIAAAHRDRSYRRTVDASYGAEAGALLAASNETGMQLAATLSHPGKLGRALLASQLTGLVEASGAEASEARALAAPPPDVDASTVVIDTLRLRAEGVAAIASTLERLLGIAPSPPTGAAVSVPRLAHAIGIAGAKGLLRHAGDELLLADETYAKLPRRFKAASGWVALPESRWTDAPAGVLLPSTLLASAPLIAHDPRLEASVRLVITAIETQPLELPLGAGYPITPTSTLKVAVSVRNVGTAPSGVTAVITVLPLGTLGRHAAGRATGIAAAQGAVALQLPTMPVVPGEHCLVTVQIIRPAGQSSRTGLRWRRTVVVASLS
jgi:hypothetical protein